MGMYMGREVGWSTLVLWGLPVASHMECLEGLLTLQDTLTTTHPLRGTVTSFVYHQSAGRCQCP